MTRVLEFLDEALQEAEESARWYAGRGETAAVDRPVTRRGRVRLWEWWDKP